MSCVQTWLSRGPGRTEPSPPSYLHPSLGGWFKALKSNYSASRVGANRPPQDSRHAESSIADGSPLPLGRSAVPLLATKSTDNEGPPTMASEPLWTAFLGAHSGSGVTPALPEQTMQRSRRRPIRKPALKRQKPHPDGCGLTKIALRGFEPRLRG